MRLFGRRPPESVPELEHLRAAVLNVKPGDQVVLAYNDGFLNEDSLETLATALCNRGATLHPIPVCGDPGELVNLSVLAHPEFAVLAR